MKLKTITFGFLFFWASISLSPLKSIELTKDLEAPSGIWVLDTANVLFRSPLYIEFYMHGEELQARKVVKKIAKSSLSSLSSLRREHSPAPAILWNLREKNGEYLYGWLRTENENEIYRCKLWQRQSKLFLRVYRQALYDTYELKPLPLSE